MTTRVVHPGSLERRRAVGATTLTIAIALAVLSAPSARAAEPTCFGQTPTLLGTAEGELLVGTPGPDVIAGLGGADQIDGRGGNDLICADADGGTEVGLGPDVLSGGAGHDQLLGVATVDEAARTLSSGDAGDDSMMSTRVTYASAPRGVTVRLDLGVARGWGDDTFSSVSDVRGSAFPDVLVGNDVPLDAEGECGELGCDTLDGGSGADELDGLHGFDRLIGGRGNDRLSGGAGSDTLTPGPGDDDVRGGPGSADTVDYFSSPHAVVVDLASHLATGLGRDSLHGLDRVTGSRFADVLRGDERANVLAGSAGADLLRGRAGADVLFGSEGRDRLYGGAGMDSASGGEGDDECVAEQVSGCER